jgi:uncharacterized protein
MNRKWRFFLFILAVWMISIGTVTVSWAQTQGQSSEQSAQPAPQPPAQTVAPAPPAASAPAAPAAPPAVTQQQAPAPAPAKAPERKPKSLAEAIQFAKEDGVLKADAPPGYLGLPGGPSPSLILGFLWAVWVGWIFSTVGAFGGVMAGVGHITVFGLGDYARSFKQSSPYLNKALTDSIRVSNQYLVGLSAAISTLNYYKMGRIVLPLGIALGLGSIFGATAIPWLTAGKINLSQYQGYFGLIVFILGGFLIYEMTPTGAKSKQAARAAAKAFEQSIKEKKTEAEIAAMGVKVKSFSLAQVSFSFFGVEFKFNPLWPFIGGVVISAISSFIGVGGGFLYVPFLTSVTGLPMYIVAGTSALTVLISMVTSIFNYMLAGALVSWSFVGVEMLGIFAGSVIGPKTSKYIPEKGLKILFIILAIYTGLGYFSKGFFGTSWVPGI